MKMIRWVALVVVVMVGFVSGAFAQGPPPYGAPISLDVAKKLTEAAIAEAKKNNWGMVVVVTDEGGSLIFLERLDGTHNASVDVAIMKARYSQPSPVAMYVISLSQIWFGADASNF
jgi:hypothetical protein